MNGSQTREEKERALLANLQAHRDELRALLAKCSDHWNYEDSIYRFYHGSFKVFGLQERTTEIVSALNALLPEQPMNVDFLQIVAEGTGRSFTPKTNSNWLQETRPIVEAFFHARFMLEMAVKYSAELNEPPQMLPSGWAALLYAFNLR